MYTVTEGSRAEVFHGTAKHTAGGLTKGDLVQDKYGGIKSKAAVAAAKLTETKETILNVVPQSVKVTQLR